MILHVLDNDIWRLIFWQYATKMRIQFKQTTPFSKRRRQSDLEKKKKKPRVPRPPGRREPWAKRVRMSVSEPARRNTSSERLGLTTGEGDRNLAV